MWAGMDLSMLKAVVYLRLCGTAQAYGRCSHLPPMLRVPERLQDTNPGDQPYCCCSERTQGGQHATVDPTDGR